MSKKKTQNNKFTLREYYAIFVIISGVVYFVGLGIYRGIKNYCLNQYAVTTQAVIIDEKNFWGNSPVSHEFSYSYCFFVNENNYTGNSFNSKLSIGDSIQVDYCTFYPKFNRPSEVNSE